MERVRIATVKATGKKYMVLSMRFPKTEEAPTVTCWGDVYQVNGLKTRHQGHCKIFLKEEVDVVEVPRTKDVLRRLLRQYLRELKDEGYDVTIQLTRKGEISYEAFNGKTRMTIH